MESTPTNPSFSQEATTRTPRDQQPTRNHTPASRRPVHTPLNRSASHDLRNSVQRATSASGGQRANNNAPTPHAKAARRALRDRRTAMFTPGKNRRRSQMEQRETPMGILRNLGKALAPKTKPISSSSSSSSGPTPPSQSQSQRRRRNRSSGGRSSGVSSILEDFEDSDDEVPLKKPRLSLPIDQDDDDEEELRPPRLSGVEKEDYTVQSIELPRRADFDREQASRMSRGSLAGDRLSDVFGNEPTEDFGRPSDFFPEPLEDFQGQRSEDAELERIDAEPTVRYSDFGLEMPAFEETTFAMSEPPADAEPTVPIEERSLDEAVADDAATADQPEPFMDLSDREPVEDIPDQSDEGGVPMDVFSDRGDIDDMPPAPADVFSDDGGGVDVEATAHDEPISRREMPSTTRDALPPKKKGKRFSHYGIEYPHLPPAFVKRVAQTALQSSGLSNPRVTADTLTALTQASDWFFEQLGDDLGAYAKHAKRKTIEESDMITLMRRQRQIGSNSTIFSLAQKHLPRELLQELRMPLPPSKKRQTKRPREDDAEAAEDT